MSKRRQIYLTLEEAGAVYRHLWLKLDEQFGPRCEDGALAAHRCVLASARERIVRAFPELRDDRVEGPQP